MDPNPEALSGLNKGLSAQSASSTISGIGGACIGWPLGAALAGAENPPWFLAGIGAAIVVISIPIYTGGEKKIQSALDLYNDSMTFFDEPELNIHVGTSSSGITLAVAF